MTDLSSSTLVSVDISQKVCDSPFSFEWVLSGLVEGDEKFRTLNESSKVTKVFSSPIGTGQGFVSKVYHVVIEFDNSEDPYQVVLKVPGTASINDAVEKSCIDTNTVQDHEFVNMHNLECQFYENFAAHIDAAIPKVFKIQKWEVGAQPGALLMESLVGKTHCSAMYGEANIEKVFSAVREICALQKYFLCLPADQWRGKFPFDQYDSFTKSDFFSPFLVKLKEMRPGMFGEGVDVFLKYVNQLSFVRYTFSDVGKDVGLPTVLCHGDYSNNNLLWRKNPDGTVSDELVAVIDWQVSFQIRRAYRANFVGQTFLALFVAPFYWGNKNSLEEEVQLEKYLSRALLCLEDGLERLKELPEEKLLDNGK
uniref:CHK domain-containing protein n=1 Tax=Steinernema glaseri TaxID=37863 RepID=A0A1I7ZHY9_9BILA